MLAFTSHTPPKKNNLDSLIYSYMLINTLLRDSTIVNYWNTFRRHLTKACLFFSGIVYCLTTKAEYFFLQPTFYGWSSGERGNRNLTSRLCPRNNCNVRIISNNIVTHTICDLRSSPNVIGPGFEPEWTG